METLAFEREYSFLASSVYSVDIYQGKSAEIQINNLRFTATNRNNQLYLQGLPGYNEIKLNPGQDVILAFKGNTVAVLFSNNLAETAQKIRALANYGWDVYRVFTDGGSNRYSSLNIEKVTTDFSKWREGSVLRSTYQETLRFRLEDGND